MRLLRDTRFIVSLIILVGAYLRISPLFGRDFPINDGGMWIAFSRALQSAWPYLPESFFFNGTEVQSNYPPVAAYLLAALNSSFGISFLSIELYLPALLSFVSLLLFIVFAHRFDSTNSRWLWASAVFAVMLNAHRWFVMGGGIPRDIGLLAQLCCWVLFLCRADSADNARRSFLSINLIIGLLFGLTVLTHPTAALWTAMGLVFLRPINTSRDLIRSASIIMIGGLVASPWIITVLTRYGITPYISAFSEGQQSISHLGRLVLMPGDLFAPTQTITIFGIVGVAAFIVARDLRAVLLLMIGLLIDPRGMTNLHGVPILALIMGRGLEATFAGILSATAPLKHSLMRQIGISIFPVIVFASSIHVGLLFGSTKSSYLSVPTAGDILAIRELGSRYSGTQHLLILSMFAQSGDGLNEWIATLTPHHSVTMHQGREWTGDFMKRQVLQRKLEVCCQEGSVMCLKSIMRDISVRIDHVLVHVPSCPLLANVADDEGVIFQEIPKPAAD